MNEMKCENQDEQRCNLFGPRCPCQSSGNITFSPLASTAAAAVTAAHCNVKDLVQLIAFWLLVYILTVL